MNNHSAGDQGIIRIAYGSIPKDGGTYTFYQNLRSGLLEHKIELYCVSIGKQECMLWNPRFADDGCISLANDIDDRKLQAQTFEEWSRSMGIQLVMPMNSIAMHCAIPHLSSDIRVISRVADAIDLGYKIATNNLNRLSKIVATTPKHVDDLSSKYSIDQNLIVLIPHGIDPKPYDLTSIQKSNHRSTIRLGFLGRLEHNQKGVLYLPSIVKNLVQAGVEHELYIAGAGFDEERLRRLLEEESMGSRVELVGRIEKTEIPDFLRDIDIFLFPSRFEGFGFTLIEAMMAGCVPVASEIAGLTSFIIQNGNTGILCPIGDTRAFADAIRHLSENRDLLEKMGKASALDARERFTQTRMVDEYYALINQVIKQPLAQNLPRNWADFEIPKFFSNTWRGWIPRPVKNLVRNLMHRNIYR